MIEFTKKLNELYGKIPDSAKRKQLKLPFSLFILKKCINLNIIKTDIHLIDLQVLIISLEIDSVQQLLDEQYKRKLNERGISSVEHVSGTEALKYL